MQENSYAFPSVCQATLFIFGGSASDDAVALSDRRWVQTTHGYPMKQGRGFLLSHLLGVSICGRAASSQMWTVSALLLKMVGETAQNHSLLCGCDLHKSQISASLEEAVS